MIVITSVIKIVNKPKRKTLSSETFGQKMELPTKRRDFMHTDTDLIYHTDI